MATRVSPETPRACAAQAVSASRASCCGQLKLGALCVPAIAEQVPMEPAASDRLLVGPFSERPGGVVGREILNGNGAVFCWTLGEEAADFLVRLLNLADQQGRLPPT